MSVRPTSESTGQVGPERVRPGLTELALGIARIPIVELEPQVLLHGTCGRLTELCGLAGCAAVLFDRSTGSVRTLVASHPEAEQLTRLVQQLGEGAGSAAIWSGLNTAIEDLTRAARADLAEAAGRVGLPVTAVIALRGAGGLLGCLQLFGAAPGELTQTLLDELAPLANVLATAVDNAESYQHSAELVAQLSAALHEQAPIEQAKGMLAERHQIDVDAAYRMLREQARRRDRTVRTVAAELVNQSWQAATPVPEQAATPHPEQSIAPGEQPFLTGDQTPLPEQRAVPSEAPEAESHRTG